ncbi:MAG: nucleoside triphosphate pyrophosphohydrolase [Candidatus Latescibacteria bacterium]|jgi:tetrapyrrole methylase family protein / MazG family protein|nr:nucleoside triphosphate pyrophosphohydrolase [Candidatus Latescibacterota bacterium]
MSSFDELITIIKILQAPGGCPWDREQTHKSLKPYFLEEVYEALEAIDSGSDDHLAEELGDVMLQVVFHAEIASREGRFDIEDVTKGIVDKLKRRHPHVFADATVENSKEVLRNWEAIKRREKREKKKGGSVLDGLPKGLPALIKARRIQEKVSRVGFDWERTEEVMLKVEEELRELKEARDNNDPAAVEEELGDLLFAVANLARFVSVCPEDALRKTIDKFQRRFMYIERELPKRGKKLGETSLEEMDELWEEIKTKERKQD